MSSNVCKYTTVVPNDHCFWFWRIKCRWWTKSESPCKKSIHNAWRSIDTSIVGFLAWELPHCGFNVEWSNFDRAHKFTSASGNTRLHFNWIVWLDAIGKNLKFPSKITISHLLSRLRRLRKAACRRAECQWRVASAFCGTIKRNGVCLYPGGGETALFRKPPPTAQSTFNPSRSRIKSACNQKAAHSIMKKNA